MNLARLLPKSSSIQWSAANPGSTTGTFAEAAEFGEILVLAVKGKVLTVKWKLTSPKPGSITPQIVTHPGQAVLAERFEGEVKFDPPAPKGGAKEKE